MTKLNRRNQESITISTKRQTKNLKCKDIEVALIKCNGLTTQAAAVLGISFHALKQAIKENPTLAKVLENAEEINLDFAESKLREMIDSKIPSAVFFYLKCKGKKRGYEENAPATTIPTQPIIFNYIPATKENIEAANRRKRESGVE